MIAGWFRQYVSAYQGLSARSWLLAGVMLINRSGTMVLPYLTLYLTRHLHFSVTEAGLIMGIYGTGSLAGTFLGGFLTDRLGFYRVQLLSLTLGGFMLLVLQFVAGFWPIAATVFVFTCLGDTFRPANSSAVAHYAPIETRTRALSLNRLAINLGWSVGGGLGGYLAGIDYRLLFWVDGLTCLLAAGALRLLLPPVPFTPKICSVEPSAKSGQPISDSPWRDWLYLVFISCVTLFSTAFLQLFSMLPLYFRQVMNLTEGQIGVLLTLNGLMIVVLEMGIVHQVETRLRRPTTLIPWGVLLTGLSYSVLNTGSWLGLALVSTVLVTIGEMLAMPFMMSWAINRATDQNRGQYMGLYAMAYSLSQIMSPAIGSQMVVLAGFRGLWYVIFGVSVISASGFWWLGDRLARARPMP